MNEVMRLDASAAGGWPVADLERLRALGIRALGRMYRSSEQVFAFRLRRDGGRDVLEGISRRYTSIVLTALAGESPEVAEAVLGADRVEDVCTRAIEAAQRTSDPGEVALALWAARALGHPGSREALDALRAVRPDTASLPTVELAWALSALTVHAPAPSDAELGVRVAERVKRSYRWVSGLFPHWPAGASGSRLRGHVCCYADLVYPIQALANHYRAAGDPQAREIAIQAAARMCSLQGAHGQWWWHYDVRTGRVLERYPVYAIHQDAMGPMALLAAQECCGGDYGPAIARSMRWLFHPPELAGSLIDVEAGVIWRKVARREPGKLARHLQAGLSRLHPRLRIPGVDVLFPTGAVDYETRPYHMGWMLHAWNPARLAGWRARLSSRGAA